MTGFAGQSRIYVISLPEAVERRAFMRAQLNAPGMPPWRFVDAVKAADLSPSEIAQRYDEAAAPRKLTPSEIGCAISHAAVLRLALENDDAFAIVLEDDALLSARFPEIVQGLEARARSRPDCVALLSCAQLYHQRGRVRIGRDHHLHAIRVAHGAQGYLVTRQSAQRLLRLWTPILGNPDDWTHFKASGGLDIQCVVPYCVGHGLIGRSSQLTHVNYKAPITTARQKWRKRLFYNFARQTLVEPLLGLKRQKAIF